MKYSAAVVTVSDKGARGERLDTSGPAVEAVLEAHGWTVRERCIIPDEREVIAQTLIRIADETDCALVLTTGGTGFSPRDVTPEATKAVIEREVPGIPEAMRAASMQVTDRGCLSRAAAGLRGDTLIVNLPGSEKAAGECLLAVIEPLRHGVDMLRGWDAECARPAPRVLATCVSAQKGEQKHPVDAVTLLPDHGIEGDAHAGTWHRQVSLLGTESVQKVQQHIRFPLLPGAFAENLLTEGITLYTLPVGTRLLLGSALVEVTQIGKECHNDCAIRKVAGDCVMPREGIFVKVITGGTVRAGDPIRIVK